MLFVYPGFLWAFFLLAIPIIIHLFSFRRFKKIYFSNVRFLKEIKEETASRSNIKHLLILLSRLFALSALILAFSQPYFSENKNLVKATARPSAIYIDNSFSMESGGVQINLLDQSKKAAHSLVMSYPVSARFYLITNDFNAGYQGEMSREEMLEAIDRVTVSPVPLTLRQINQNVEEIFRNEFGSIVYLFSDFQQNSSDFTPDSSIQYKLIPAKATRPSNLAIDSSWLDAPVFLLERDNRLMVRIHNYSDEALKSVPLRLFINDEQKAMDEISIEANSSLIDTISFRFESTGWNLMKLMLQDYPVQFDDTYFQRYYVKPEFRVLEINSGNASSFIQAMQIPGLMRIESMNIGQIDLSRLNRNSLLILNQISNISSGVLQQFEQYVRLGGSLLILPGSAIESSTLNSWLKNLSGIQYEALNNHEATVNYLEQQQSLFFDVFENIQERIRLPKCQKYFPIHYLNRADMDKLMLLDNGDAFLTSAAVGKGHLFLSVVPAEIEFSDWPKTDLFAVGLVQMAASEATSSQASIIIGKEQIIRERQVDLENDQILHLSNEQIDLLAPQQKIGMDILLHLGTIIKESGHYKLGIKDSTPIDVLAFNYNRSESDLSVFEADELKERYPQPNVSVIKSGIEMKFEAINGLNSINSLWKLCLILALAFLAIEILLLRLLKG